MKISAEQVFLWYDKHTKKVVESLDMLDLYIITILKKSVTPRKMPFLHTILVGRRTGQAVQDTHLFQMQHLFGLVPNLKATFLEARLTKLTKEGTILATENGYIVQEEITLTFETVYPRFQGFAFQRLAFDFFANLRLAVQVVSNKQHKLNYYLPVIRDKKIQQFIKNWLSKQNQATLADSLYRELIRWFKELEVTRPEFLVERFSGRELMGYTTEQIATNYNQPKWNVYFEMLHEIHRLFAVIKQQADEWNILRSLIPSELTALTTSAVQTLSLWENGADIETIEKIRSLKTSTIQDHFVEIRATQKNANVPCLPNEELIKAINSSDWHLLREIKAAFPELDYYQIRLAVVSRSGIE